MKENYLQLTSDGPESATVNLPEVFPSMSGSPSRDLGIQTTMMVKI